MNRQGLILAAGKGSRMPSQEIPKVMYQLEGKPMVSYLVNVFKQVGISKPILVVGYKKELVKEYFGDEVNYAVQEEQLGTGDAVRAANSFFADKSVPVLIAYGDMPFWSRETIEKIFAKQEDSGAKLVLATVDAPELESFGRIVRDREGKIVKNVEAKDCSKEELKIIEKNPSLYLVESGWLFKSLRKIKTDNAQGEYYLTDIIEIAVEEGIDIETIKVSDRKEAMGVNTKEDYQAAKKEI